MQVYYHGHILVTVWHVSLSWKRSADLQGLVVVVGVGKDVAIEAVVKCWIENILQIGLDESLYNAWCAFSAQTV